MHKIQYFQTAKYLTNNNSVNPGDILQSFYTQKCVGVKNLVNEENTAAGNDILSHISWKAGLATMTTISVFFTVLSKGYFY